MDIFGFNGGLNNQQGFNPCCGLTGLGGFYNPYNAAFNGTQGSPTNWYFNSPVGNHGSYTGMNQSPVDAVLQNIYRSNPFLASFQQHVQPIAQGVSNNLAGLMQYNPMLRGFIDYNLQLADAYNTSIRQASERAAMNVAGIGASAGGWNNDGSNAAFNPLFSHLHTQMGPQGSIGSMQHLANGFMSGFTNGQTQWSPAIDIIERPDAILVRADIPGYSGKDVDVYVEHNVLVLRGQRESQREEHLGTFHSLERQSGSFYRRINLPYAVEASQIKAKLLDGTLELAIPKQGRNQVELGEVKSTKVKVA